MLAEYTHNRVQILDHTGAWGETALPYFIEDACIGSRQLQKFVVQDSI